MRKPVRRLATFPWQILTPVLAVAALWSGAALALSGSQVYERVQDSVVVVMAYDRAGKAVGLGSGVVLPSGEIITNYHVVKTGVRYTVGQKGKTAPASLQGKDPEQDLALLLAPGLTATPARLGQASRLKVGDKVFAVGSPQGLELSLSEGIVSQLRGGPPPMIQTTVAISPGSSGGGLFNAEGELVGITTFYLKEGQGLNFAVPVEWVAEFTKGISREVPKKQAHVVPKSSDGPKGMREGFDPSDYILPQERAVDCEKAEDWHGLLEACLAWINNEPENALAWHKLGFSYEKLGRHREAKHANQQALRFKPDFAEAWNNLGNAYGKLGHYREEIEAYQEALRLKPGDAIVWYNLGNAYWKLFRFQEAIEAYREALRLKPNFANAWNNLALAYGISGNRAAALQAVKELRRYDPQRADKLFNIIMKP